MGLLDNDLRQTIGASLDFLMLNLTLRRMAGTLNSVTGVVTPTTPTDYSCRGFVENYSTLLKATNAVQDNDVKVTLLQIFLVDTFGAGVTPLPGDRVVLPDGNVGAVIKVDRDPANATWELQVRK